MGAPRVGILALRLQVALDEVAAAERESMPIQSSPEVLKLQSAGLIEMRVQSWRPESGPPWERAALTPAGRIVHETRRPTAVEAVPRYFAWLGPTFGPVLAVALSLAFAATVWAGFDAVAYGAWWQPLVPLGPLLGILIGVLQQADRRAGVELRGELERLVPESLRREEWDA